jgi:CoA:oxalate CoA-transferase
MAVTTDDATGLDEGHPERLLEGVRVLDFTQYLAGPSCTRLMVELGAEVIKVEAWPDGDPLRAIKPERGGTSASFVQQNRGKRSIRLDLRKPEAIAAVKRIVPHVDVVIENATPGVMARRGLGYDDLKVLNPRLIMASVSGFGQTGSHSSRSCFDFIAQGMAGLMHMTGEPDGPPYFVGIGVGDTNAGVHAFAGIALALYRRDRTGRGCHLDISMVEALFHMQEYSVAATSMTGGEFVPIRQGLHYQPISPAGTFRGPQGWIVVLCMPNQWPMLWQAMDRPDLATDPRFADYEARVTNRDELTALIEAWMATFATDEDVLAVLTRHRVPSGPVLSPADALTHPLFVERGAVRTVRDTTGGTFTIPGFPFLIDGIRPDRDVEAAVLGADTTDVLTSFGMHADEIAAVLAEQD